MRDTGRVGARTIPAWQVMQGDVRAADIDGTIVFIGTSAAGLHDLRVTPLDAAAPGVDVHARIAEQMVLGDFLERPDWIDGLRVRLPPRPRRRRPLAAAALGPDRLRRRHRARRRRGLRLVVVRLYAATRC